MSSPTRDQLLMGYLSGSLAQEDLPRLEKLLLEDPDAAPRLAQLSIIEYLLIDTSSQDETTLEQEAGNVRPLSAIEMSMLEDISMAPQEAGARAEIEARAERQLQSFLAEQERLRSLQAQAQRRSFYPSISWSEVGRKIDRLSTLVVRTVVGLAASIALVLVLILVAKYIHNQRIVATLDDSFHAQWDLEMQGPELFKRQRMTLEQGFAQLTFKKGAEVLLQAPCEFELLTTNKLQLYHGALTAKVPTQAKGFTVETPASRVIDFGTEFGVLAGLQSEAQIHVFSGQVGLGGGQQPGKTSAFKTVADGLAAMIDSNGQIVVDDLKNHGKLFVRKLPESNQCGIPGYCLNLADIVGGGNGFGSGTINTAINPLTGAWCEEPVSAVDMSDYTAQAGPGGYITTKQLPLVDGLFVPDGSAGPVQITSAGHYFQCPDTVGSFRTGVTNGARIVMPDGQRRQIEVRGQPYGVLGNPAIFLHSNLGITFDLDAIRKTLPSVRLVQFRSLCGMDKINKSYHIGEAWVLVDGNVRFHEEIKDRIWLQVIITLEPGDRFLTLVGTDNGNSPSDPDDWIMFAEPALDLRYVAESDRQQR